MATKLHGQAGERFARIPEVQELHLAESSQAVSSQDCGRISLQLGKSFFQTGSGTSAAEDDFFSRFTAGMNACSTPCMDASIWCLSFTPVHGCIRLAPAPPPRPAEN